MARMRQRRLDRPIMGGYALKEGMSWGVHGIGGGGIVSSRNIRWTSSAGSGDRPMGYYESCIDCVV